ncbi:hypothetical protein R1sor_012596 [Riccia sorocarpa]|uniref:C2H2-type domain-containing protein n=1 Tax=Riccia sorocarpa TaxID=122646 RepID=A0ABD3I491_9MARC
MTNEAERVNDNSGPLVTIPAAVNDSKVESAPASGNEASSVIRVKEEGYPSPLDERAPAPAVETTEALPLVAVQPAPEPPPAEINLANAGPITTQNNEKQQGVKRKRNLPGTPDPDAEVVALSPTTLMATHKFTCEVCGRGFQREQNLQLHKRGHNLPGSLKPRANKDKEVRKKVYVCPEPTCVHHDPARALGDLTGIKKHFCRKHGEKKWKCEKCCKKYAVLSDWKAHSKTCGTRDYKCECGSIFYRRDSFVTHKAFCDELAEESARLAAGASEPPAPVLLLESVKEPLESVTGPEESVTGLVGSITEPLESVSEQVEIEPPEEKGEPVSYRQLLGDIDDNDQTATVI